MMRRLLALLWIFALAISTPAEAGPLRLKTKGQGEAGAAPTLAATTIPFGAWTQFGKGTVRLSSPTLGLVVSEGGSAITSWSVTTQATGVGCGNSAHWTAAGSVAEGSSAITPTSSIAGDTAHLASGDCNFTVTATNGNGTSAPVAITMDVDPNAASIGDNSANFPGGVFANPYTVAGFEAGTTIGQRSLLLTPGIDRGTTGINFNNQFDFTSYVQLKDADPARPSLLDKVQIQNGSYWEVYDLTLSSASRSPESGGRVYASGTDFLKLTNVQGGTGINSFVQNLKCVFLDTVSNVEITNLECYGQMGGLYIGAGSATVTVNGLKVRWYSERGIQIGSASDVTISDFVIASPRRIPGSVVHIDAVQIEDLSTPSNLLMQRGMILVADAYNSTYQGVFYGSGSDTTTVFQAADLHFNGLFISNGAPTCWGAPASNSGTSYAKNITCVKNDTGVYTDCTTPEGDGACPTTAGATMSMGNVNSARYSGTFTFSYIATDDVLTIASGNGGSKDAATVIEANHGSLTNYFADPNARATLEAIDYDTWYAMSLDTIIATYKAAYAAKLNGDLKVGSVYVGAWDPDGNWNTN